MTAEDERLDREIRDRDTAPLGLDEERMARDADFDENAQRRRYERAMTGDDEPLIGPRTPLPWRYKDGNGDTGFLMRGEPGGRGEIHVLIYPRADATYMHEACNNYELVIEALEVIRSMDDDRMQAFIYDRLGLTRVNYGSYRTRKIGMMDLIVRRVLEKLPVARS